MLIYCLILSLLLGLVYYFGEKNFSSTIHKSIGWSSVIFGSTFIFSLLNSTSLPCLLFDLKGSGYENKINYEDEILKLSSMPDNTLIDNSLDNILSDDTDNDVYLR